jgi:hypothetical protein
MRRNLAVLVGVGGLTGLGFAELATTADAPREAATIVVDVNVTCSNGGVQMSVSPWEIAMNQGDDIDWVLSNSAQSSTIEITPKNPGRWPFADANHAGGRGAANAARARNMRANQAGRFQYNITLECQDGDADPVTVVIDPDIIITPGE